jgi:hypothetical protein
MQGPYADTILDARDVCNNCFRKNRVERVDPVMSRAGLRHELDSHFARDKRETVLDWHDGGERPTEAKGVWCNCGVEGSYDRLWEPNNLDRERFKTLLKQAVISVEQKGVTLKRRETLRYALSHFDDHGDADQALATALDAGIVAACADSS